MSYTIRWKYFFPINEQPQIITTGNIVCFSGKFVVENSEQCLTVASANILDAGYSNHEFSIANIPSCIPHCMLSAFITCTPQKVNNFIYFDMECLEYNAITSTSNVKIKITVLYPFHSIRFQKYLDPSGSNIKLNNDRSSIKSNTIAAHKSSETPIVIIDDDTESNPDDKEKQPNRKDNKK
ncbi:19317_t:CDS:2, partial [Racocetra persica]